MMRVKYSEPLAAWIFPRQGTQCGHHSSTKSSISFPEVQQSIPGIIIVFSYSFVRNIRCIKEATVIGLFRTSCVLV